MRIADFTTRTDVLKEQLQWELNIVIMLPERRVSNLPLSLSAALSLTLKRQNEFCLQ